MSNLKMDKEVENEGQGAHYFGLSMRSTGKLTSHTSKSNTRTGKMNLTSGIPVHKVYQSSKPIYHSNSLVNCWNILVNHGARPVN
jgi:hypothetical protein